MCLAHSAHPIATPVGTAKTGRRAVYQHHPATSLSVTCHEYARKLIKYLSVKYSRYNHYCTTRAIITTALNKVDRTRLLEMLEFDGYFDSAAASNGCCVWRHVLYR